MRTLSARLLALSCAGPGRSFWMDSRCFINCSSSFLILSSSLHIAAIFSFRRQQNHLCKDLHVHLGGNLGGYAA